MNVLITGGAGYIGSHIAADLLARKHNGVRQYNVAILTHPSTDTPRIMRQLEALTNRRPMIYRTDIRDIEGVQRVISMYKPEAIIHLAGLKQTDGSELGNRICLDVNVGGTHNILKAMQNSDTRILIYGSSPYVHGDVTQMNVITQSKLVSEKIIDEVGSVGRDFRIACLRYAMVNGANATGFLAENEITSSYSPFAYFSQVACHERKRALLVPCSRDHIHVSDVASAHHYTLEYLKVHTGVIKLDIGTGNPISTDHLLRIFEQVNQVVIPYDMVERPESIIEVVSTDTGPAETHINWRATTSVERICHDMWFAYITGANSTNDPPRSRILACRTPTSP